MGIVLVRVDDRLVHGQIVEGWLPSTRAQELLVANDALADDPVQRMIVMAAIPRSVSLVIDTVEGIADRLTPEANGAVRRMILVSKPVDALRLWKAGVHFRRLNLGNLRCGNVSLCLSRSVVVGEESLKVLCALAREGIKVDIQSVPFEKRVRLDDVCREFAGV
jgi:PTS system mannose-specific IIB component